MGICSRIQIIRLIFGAGLEKEFLSLIGEHSVYHLHNNYVHLPNEFEKYINSKIIQAFKHKKKPIYGILFHPEVRNKKIIETFLSL